MACGCGSKVCSCAIVQGSGISVTGTGSSGNPYVITSTGGSAPITTTIAALNALATAGSLIPGSTYAVTDWTAAPALPGPNTLFVKALDASTPSGFVEIQTPLGPVGPTDGEFIWNYLGSVNLMVRVRDSLGNDVMDFGTTAINNFPWGDASVYHNSVYACTLSGLLVSPGVSNMSMHGNTFHQGTVTYSVGSPGAYAVWNTRITDGTLTVAGGSGVIQDCDIREQGSATLTTATSMTTVTIGSAASLSVNAPSTGTNLNDVEIRDLFQLVVTASGSSFEAQGCTFVGNSDVTNNVWTCGGSNMTYQIEGCNIRSAFGSSAADPVTWNGAAGTLLFVASNLQLASVARNAAATGNVTIKNCDLLGGKLTFGAAASGEMRLEAVRGFGTVGTFFEIDQEGAGLLNIRDTSVNSSTVATTSSVVRDLVLLSCTLTDETGFTYSRSAAASGTDTVQGCFFSGATFVITGATDPGSGQTYLANNVNSASQVTLTNPASSVPFSFTVVEAGSILNVQAGGKILKSRVSGGGTLNTGAFTQTSVFHDSNATTTLTAANTNTMKNPLGSNVV